MGWLNKYQQGGYSTTGYKADSPDRYNPYNIIPSGRITMQNVPHPVLGIDNFGNRQMMQSGGEYQFQGDQVFEVPAMKEGGIPQRYKTMGFTHVGQKKAGDGQHKWKVLAKKGDSYKVVQGGYRGMQDFKQHHSEERKDRFWDRMGGRDSSKAKDPFSPLYWHKRFGTWEYGGAVPSSEMYKDGGMIKRADGSYSQRGLWDNIRANAGSGKKPTKEMLQQERKIRAVEKKEYGGWLNEYQDGGTTQAQPEYSIVDYLASQGQDYSKGHRAELAQQYGIQGYDYSAEKNLELLSKLKAATSLPQKPAGAPPVFTELMNWPETKPVPPVQVSKKQQTFNKDQARTVANKQAAFSNVRYQGEYMGQPTGRVSTPAPVHIPFADTQYQGEYQGQVMRTPVTRPDSFNVPNIIPVDVPYRKPADSNKQPIIKNTNFGNIKFNPNQGLDSGIVVDKQSNQAFIIKNHKVVHSFPVLTGSNPQDNPNLFSVDELEANKIGRTTPAGVYDISPNSSIYGKRGFDLYNPDLIKNVKIHTIYPGDYAARMQGLLSSDPEERRMSYGCINAQDCDIEQEYKYFPQGGKQLLHVLPVNQSKSINDYMTLPSQKYGGWLNEYQDGGDVSDQSTLEKVANVVGDKLGNLGVSAWRTMGNFIADKMPDTYTQQERENIFNTYRPVKYPGYLGAAKEYVKGVFGQSDLPLKDPQGDYNIGEEAWRKALDIPTKEKYITESKYKPTNAKDPNAKYYTLNDVIDQEKLIQAAKRKGMSPGAVYQMEALTPYIKKEFMDRVKFIDTDPLQKFQLSVDPKGKYVSIYDKYDFDFAPANKVIKPYEFYDRFYLPKEKKKIKEYGGWLNKHK